MKKFLVIILLTMGAYAFAGHQTKSFLIQFATDEHALDPTALKKLDEVTTYLNAHPNAKIKLTGRTDFDGTVGYNITLSRLRTTEVAEFLKTKGWQNAEIDEKWVGELKPIASNTDDNGKALNRSVEIFISIVNYENATEWLKEKQEESKETFNLKRSGQNTITTNNETVITIPSGAFISPDGKPIDNKNVKLVVKEVNTKMDAIINQVFTMSGDKLLETGGMMNIEAYSNNTQLVIADGKEISIQIPTAMQKNDMFVFEGVADGAGRIDWKNTGKPFATNAQKNRTSLKLNEDILMELINGIDQTSPNFTDFTLTYTLPKMVNVPSKPILPKEPKRPEAKTLFSTLGWVLSTKRMKEKRVEKVHKENLANYEKRLDYYNIRQQRYEIAMEKNKTEIEKFEAEKELFYDWLRKTRHAINLSVTNIYDAHDKMRASRGLLKLYNQSKNQTQYSQKPLGYLRNFARTTRLSEEETLKLEYLSGLQRSVIRLQSMEYPAMVKKYGRNGKIKIVKTKTKFKNEILGSDRLWTNKFLDNYIVENKETFAEAFPNEMNEQIADMERQTLVSNQNASREYFSGVTKKMGWINCDRFASNQLVTVSFTRLPGAFQAIILNSMNSVLSTSYYKNSTDETFASVPKNEKFRVLTFKIEGDQAFVSIIEATAEANLKLEPEFKKMPIEEADKLMAKL